MPESKREKGNRAEDFAVHEYKKRGCKVQKVYLKAGYKGPGQLYAKPGDFFLTTFLDGDGKPEIDPKTKKPRKGGVIDVIAVCPDGVYLDSVTSASADNASKNMSNVHLRMNHIDQGFPGEFGAIFRVSYYIGSDRHNFRRWNRKSVGVWIEEQQRL